MASVQNDLEVVVTEVTTCIDLAGIAYHDSHAEVRICLTTTSGTSIELPIRVPYNALPDGDRSPSAVVKSASYRLRDLAETFHNKAVQIWEELGEGTWPFPMT